MPKKATIVSGIALILLLALIMTVISVSGTKKDPDNIMPERVSVFFPELNEIRIMRYNDFLSGCAAGMFPPGIETENKAGPEAIRAVVIAANSRAAYQLKNKDPSKSFGADFTVGDDFPYTDTDREDITQAVNQQLPLLTYEGEPINAQTCAISAGVTDAAAPYSPSVPLFCDVSAKGYESVTAFTYETVRRALHQNAVSRNFEEWFYDPVYAETGTLTYIGFCNTRVTGAALRKALDLRSTAITVEYREEKFYFHCKGLGENRGMSVNAAMFLEENGKTAEEILKLFYPGCELKQ
ncbi:MAG: hypothetical protein K2N56_00185 [Oscillospiraceae bacterium]|nr:hypothetical protein [Oscillospiraceae bacterium]